MILLKVAETDEVVSSIPLVLTKFKVRNLSTSLIFVKLITFDQHNSEK